MDLNKRALKAAREAAQKQAVHIRLAWINKSAKDWAELASKTNITIPPVISAQPYSWPAVQMLINYWVDNVESRIRTEVKIKSIKSDNRPKLQPSTSVQTFGSVTLLPEQQAVVDKLYEDFFVHKLRKVAIQDGGTGSGKSFAAGGLICKCIADNLHKIPGVPFDIPYRYLIVTRKTVVETYKRYLEEFGLGHLIGTTIIVTSYSQLSARYGELFGKEVYDPYKETTEIKINELLAPYLIIWDECHALNNPDTKQTRFSLAMQKIKNPPYQWFMSATFATTVNNIRTFVIAAGFKFMGYTVTEENFKSFAGSICDRPERPNLAAAKRVRELLADYIYSFPKVRWKHRAINSVLIVDFEKPEHKSLYENAFIRFQEKKKMAGKNTSYGHFEQFVAFGQFCKAVEPFHVPAVIQRGMEHIKQQTAVVMGCRYRDSISTAAFMLHNLGLTRDDFSIIWGGKREWRMDRILTKEQIQALIMRELRGDPITPYEQACIEETMNFNEERIMASETSDEQNRRLDLQRKLGLLGSQSAEQRQTEIDKFQSGQAKWCLFTLAAGGVGLSLDHNRPHLWPRVGYFTPCVSGVEFQQALGRLVRRTTLSDTRQYMVYMRDTVEEYFVAPLVDKKLKCISTITNNTFNLMNMDTAPKIVHNPLRTDLEVIADAQNDESQLTGAENQELEEETE